MEGRKQVRKGGKTIGARERGFTLIELAIATVVLLVGVVAVMQLVPSAMRLNLWNRYDSTSTVVAQRLLDQMLSQPLSAAQFVDGTLNPNCQTISLGGAAPPNPPGYYGGPLLPPGTARIDFTQGNQVANYNCTYQDPNDPTGPSYEVRWAVVPTVSATGQVVAKRYLVGVWMRDPNQPYLPVTLDAWKQR